MIARFIVDCSVAMSWLFKDETTSSTRALLERLEAEPAIVPDLWYLEVANVLVLATRKGRIAAEQCADFIRQIQALDLQTDDTTADRAFGDILSLAATHGLTSYDAVYLDLALRTKLPLATLDEPLRKAAKSLGVKLLGK
jgi:predicted nucleic acid-binding protein